MKRILARSVLAGVVLAITGCDPDGGTAPVIPSECECAPAVPSREVGDVAAVPDGELERDAELNGLLSPQALRTADACGLVPLLRRYVREGDASRRAEVRGRVHERLALVSLEIASTAAELDCEEERADQIADYLLGVARALKTNLTLWSILIGAVGTVVTNVLALRGAGPKVYRNFGILFGLAVAAVGFVALRSDRAVVRFAHGRNALAELAHRPARREVLPAAVWNYLTWPDGRCGERRSLRDGLLERWERSGGLGAKSEDERRRLMALLFGRGGAYRAGELSIRATLFDQLESYVNLMKHDVLQLSRELAALDRAD